jgi:hypothetical protein
VEDNANPNELTTRAASMRRVPTQAEKDNLKKDFPNLDVNNISVTGQAIRLKEKPNKIKICFLIKRYF